MVTRPNDAVALLLTASEGNEEIDAAIAEAVGTDVFNYSTSFDAISRLFAVTLPGWIIHSEHGRSDGFVMVVVSEDRNKLKARGIRREGEIVDSRGYGFTLPIAMCRAYFLALSASREVVKKEKTRERYLVNKSAK